MTLPSWPATLPKPARQAYQAGFDDPRMKRSVEAGPPGYRRRYSSVARNVTLEIDVTRADKAVFDRFFEDETAHGSLPFSMPDPTTDGWQLLATDGAPLLGPDDVPLLLSGLWVCLFGDRMPTEQVRGVRFVINFDVAVMP